MSFFSSDGLKGPWSRSLPLWLFVACNAGGWRERGLLSLLLISGLEFDLFTRFLLRLLSPSAESSSTSGSSESSGSAPGTGTASEAGLLGGNSLFGLIFCKWKIKFLRSKSLPWQSRLQFFQTLDLANQRRRLPHWSCWNALIKYWLVWNYLKRIICVKFSLQSFSFYFWGANSWLAFLHLQFREKHRRHIVKREFRVRRSRHINIGHVLESHRPRNISCIKIKI